MGLFSAGKIIGGTLSRVFSHCGMLSQAIAYNMFLSFFPTLLIAVGFATSQAGTKTGLLDLIEQLTAYVPPGSRQLVADYITRRAPHAWRWTLFGLSVTLVAGSQVMKLIMEGIRRIYDDRQSFSYVRRQLQGLLLLCITIAPFLLAAILSVFGRPLRRWLLRELGSPLPLRGLWNFFFVVAAMVLAVTALTVIYRLARPRAHSWRAVLPGAVVATLLWWGVNALFGFYVTRIQYGMVYGGVAAVIGLLVWMYISAIVVFVGAAWNAELAAVPKRGRSN
jgi:membrane protein